MSTGFSGMKRPATLLLFRATMPAKHISTTAVACKSVINAHLYI